MSRKRRVKRSAEFKFKVALEAVKGLKTVSELVSEYQVSPAQVSQWKRSLQSEGAAIFKNSHAKEEAEQAQKEAELYEQIGRLKMELEWLKKKSIGVS